MVEMNKVNLVEISWGSEAPPDKDSRYNHVLGTHPLGKFCIEWKSWKESDSYTCYFNDEYWNDAYSLDEAKDFCQKHINKKINSCIVGVKMTQETEHLKTQLLAAEAEIARLQSRVDGAMDFYNTAKSDVNIGMIRMAQYLKGEVK